MRADTRKNTFLKDGLLPASDQCQIEGHLLRYHPDEQKKRKSSEQPLHRVALP